MRSELEKLGEKESERIGELQRVFYADARYALLIVLQGRDASGKDGTIRKVFSAVNPQGCTVSSFRVPTELEQHHDFLWRIHQQVPPRGMIGIFNRSHYEDILVPRVHDLVPKKVWSARYEQINDFERMLVGERRRDPQVHAAHLARRAEEAVRGASRRRDEELEVPRRRSRRPQALGRRSPRRIAASSRIRAPNGRRGTSFPPTTRTCATVLVARTIADTLESLDLRYPAPDPSLAGIRVE